MQLGKTEDGFAINQYFVDHPEMVLGQLTLESTQYGHDLTVAPVSYTHLHMEQKQSLTPSICSSSSGSKAN